MKKKILVVDDDPNMLEYLKESLHPEYEVEVADRARKAIGYLDHVEGQVDLVITDNKMPEMNGLELIAILKVKYPNLPVILHSGDSYATDSYSPSLVKPCLTISKVVKEYL